MNLPVTHGFHLTENYYIYLTNYFVHANIFVKCITHHWCSNLLPKSVDICYELTDFAVLRIQDVSSIDNVFIRS